MGWLSKLFDGASGGLLAGVGDIIGKFKLDPSEKAQLQLDLERLAHERFLALQAEINSELQAKERVIVAELQQADNYTKRARPTIIYVGLFMIFADWLTGAIAAMGWPEVKLPELPQEFWLTWGGVTGTYAIGRSFEKRGVSNTFTHIATGNGKKSLLTD